MRFTNLGNIDPLKRRADKRNFRFGNFNISTTRMEGFTFTSIGTSFSTSLQTSDFYLQKILYNSETDTYNYVDYLQLNNTYKKTGYFEAYDFASAIEEGFFRLRAGTLYSPTIIFAQQYGSFTTSENNGFIFNDGKNLEFADGSILTLI